MSTPQEPLIIEARRVTLILRFPEKYASLCQRLVVLPDMDGKRAWLVDLHDPFHPQVQEFTSMAAAEAEWNERVYLALCSLATEAVAALVA